jgi:hypothetical protein
MLTHDKIKEALRVTVPKYDLNMEIEDKYGIDE